MRGRAHEEEIMNAISQAIPQPRTKRRYRSAEERRRIVEETLVPGTSVAIVARGHGVNANQVFGWRKLYQSGLLGSSNAASVNPGSTSSVRLLPVTVSADREYGPEQTAVGKLGEGDLDSVASSGVIELTLAKAQVRITGKVEPSVLRVLLECLRA
jgi:transposase